MDRQYKHSLPYLFFPFLVFWAGEVTAVLMSLGVIPHDDYLVTDVMLSSLIGYAAVVVGFASLLYGMRRGFSLDLPVLVMLSVVPTIAYTYLLTNSSGVEIFLWIYGLVSLLQSVWERVFAGSGKNMPNDLKFPHGMVE